MIPALTALRLSPRVIGYLAGGVVVLGLGIYVAILRGTVSDLRDELDRCGLARALAEQRAESLAASIDEQNAAIQRLHAEMAQATSRAKQAQERAQELQRQAARDEGRIEAVHPSPVPADASETERKLASCDAARRVLTGQWRSGDDG